MIELVKEWFNFNAYETTHSEAMAYVAPPDVTKLFNVQDYDEDSGFFELVDGTSYAAVYELTPVATEGMNEAELAHIRANIESLFNEQVFPHYFPSESPWIVQTFVNDEFNLSDYVERFNADVGDTLNNTAYHQFYLHCLKEHYQFLSQPGGVFEDPLSDTHYRGRCRRVRIVFYRRLHKKSRLEPGFTPLRDIEQTGINFEKYLESRQLSFRKYNQYDFYVWMARWLSPHPPGFKDTDDYLAKTSFPKTKTDEFVGFDLIQHFFASEPKCDEHQKLWYFDECPHKFIPIAGVRNLPKDGHLTAECLMQQSSKPSQEKYFAYFDTLPDGAVFVSTVMLLHQSYIKKRVEHQAKRAHKVVGEEARMTETEARLAMQAMAHRNDIFPVSLGLYINADNEKQLIHKEITTLVYLNRMGLRAIRSGQDRRQLDRYFRFMPMNYNAAFDNKHLHQQRLLTTRTISALFPLYGRSRGTGHFGCLGFNRVGEPLEFDMWRDYINNMHFFIFGTTGSGKSSFIVALMMTVMAVHNPRIVLVDAGASMRHMVDLWQQFGKEVKKIEIKLNEFPDYSLNPFLETKAMIKQLDHIEALQISINEYQKRLNQDVEEKPDAQAQKKLHQLDDIRDYLMEFYTAAMLMIAGTEQKDIDAISRQDQFWLLEAIKRAARQAMNEGFNEMIPSDLVKMLETLALEQPNDMSGQVIKQRLGDMANSLKYFLSFPINAMYFDQRGPSLPDADVTWLELGVLKEDRKENEVPKALVLLSTMNMTLSRAERYKTSGRPFYFLGDEAHVMMSSTVTSNNLVIATKMARKLGLQIGLATQNVKDFPENAERALSMLEFKFVLWCSPEEQKKLLNFVRVTSSQFNMIQSLRKVPGHYVEAMLLSNQLNLLFRNLPPREVLAFAMTNPDENAWRAKLQEDYACNGVEASLLMAQKLKGEAYDLEKVRSLLHG